MSSLPGIRRTLACLLLIAARLPNSAASAGEPGDDQYAVAAGHYARGRWQLAVDEFDVLLRDFPGSAQTNRANFFRAEAQLQLGRHAEARRGFLAVVQASSEVPLKRQATFRAGESAFLGGDDAAARPSLEGFFAIWPDDALNAYALAYLGEIALREQKPTIAKEFFERCLTAFPEGALQDDCRFGLARTLEVQGDHEGAGRIYLALAGKRGSPLADDAQFRLAAQQYAAGEFATALETLSAFETDFAGSDLRDRARLSRGWAEFQQRELGQAERDFATLVDSPSVGVEARYWLATCHKSQRSFAAAAGEFAATAEAHPEHDLASPCRFHAGECWRMAGDSSRAKDEIDKCLAAWPQGDWADDCLLCKLRLAVDGNDHAEVERLIAAIKTQFPESDLLTDARQLQTRSLLSRKQFTQALETVRPAASPPERYLASLCYQGLAKPDEALAALAPILSEPNEGVTPELLADGRQLQAAILISKGGFQQAQVPLAKLLQDQPAAAAAASWQAQLAVCQAKAGDLEKARATFRELATAHPREAVVAVAARQLGDVALAAGDADWSSELFASLCDGEPSADVAAQGLAGLGWSRFQNKDFAAADVAFTGLLAKKPGEAVAAEAAYMHGVCRQRMADDAAALAAYVACARDYPDSSHAPPALLALARLQSQRRDFAAAAGAYERLARSYATYSQRDVALYEWAWTLRDVGDAAEGDKVFAQLKSEFPDSNYWGDAAYRLAEGNLAAGRPSEAQRHLAALSAARPEFAEQAHVLFLQGQTAAALRQWSETAKFMQQLLDKHAESDFRPLAEFWLAEAEFRQGNFIAARDRFEQLAPRLATRRDDWAATTALRRAQLLAQDRKWAEARELVAGMGQDYPGFSLQYEADYLLGRCYAARGEFNDARAAYARVVASAQGGKTETAAMAQWMIGESYFHQKKYAEALREYLKVEILYAYPNWQAASLLQAGKCCEQLGQWQQATEHYQRLIAEHPQTEFFAEAGRRLEAARLKLKQK